MWYYPSLSQNPAPLQAHLLLSRQCGCPYASQVWVWSTVQCKERLGSIERISGCKGEIGVITLDWKSAPHQQMWLAMRIYKWEIMERKLSQLTWNGQIIKGHPWKIRISPFPFVPPCQNIRDSFDVQVEIMRKLVILTYWLWGGKCGNVVKNVFALWKQDG